MGFFLRRFGRAVGRHGAWLLLALLPPLVYLVIAAQTDVTYTVSQEVLEDAGQVPVAAPDSPVATAPLSDLKADPAGLFLDGFALSRLEKAIALLDDSPGVANEAELRRRVNATMEITTGSDATLGVSYVGKDLALGQLLVGFYAERLLERVAAGAARTRSEAVPAAELLPNAEMVVAETTSAWAADRLLPTLVIFALSLLAVLAVIAGLEIAHPAFKSERQIARYLGLPLLGSLPDARQLSATRTQT